MRPGFFFSCLTTVALLALTSLAQQANPPLPNDVQTLTPSTTTSPGNGEGQAVKVLFLKSWGVTPVWEDLKTNWPNYGKIPITIDDSTYLMSDFTYQDLVSSGADVIVMSDPAGGGQQYSQDEVDAVARYALGGHTVIGTFLVFQWNVVDNRALAPILGLRSDVPYSTKDQALSNLFRKVNANECLFAGIHGGAWRSQGYPETERPTSRNRWIAGLGGATVVAESDNLKGIVSLYKTKAYTAIFVSNYPEYNGGTLDEQLLYNASTCYVTK